MMAQEARFINKQAGQGYIQLNKKPTTIAMYKFKEGKLSISDKKASDNSSDDSVESSAEMTAENRQEVAASADNAFGEG